LYFDGVDEPYYKIKINLIHFTYERSNIKIITKTPTTDCSGFES